MAKKIFKKKSHNKPRKIVKKIIKKSVKRNLKNEGVRNKSLLVHWKVILVLAIFAFSLIFVCLALVDRMQGASGIITGVIPVERVQKMDFIMDDGVASLNVPAGTSSAEVSFKFMRYLSPQQIGYRYPYQNIKPDSDLYYLKLTPPDVEFTQRPMITIKFEPESKWKNLYYWNDQEQKFVRLSAVRDTHKNLLAFEVPAVKVLIFALFEEPWQIGLASWYVHPLFPTDMMAASTDFSSLSKVKVTNLDNGKSVVVTIRDYGPDKSVFPDRILDLGIVPFQKIAPLNSGLVNVKVEQYVPDAEAKE